MIHDNHGLGNVVGITLPDGNKQTAAYTGSGLLKAATDALGHTSSHPNAYPDAYSHSRLNPHS